MIYNVTKNMYNMLCSLINPYPQNCIKKNYTFVFILHSKTEIPFYLINFHFDLTMSINVSVSEKRHISTIQMSLFRRFTHTLNPKFNRVKFKYSKTKFHESLRSKPKHVPNLSN